MTRDDIAGGPPDVAFEFGHDETAPGGARRALGSLVGADSFADDVKLAASELVTNVVKHTDDGGRLAAWNSRPFRLEVHDTSAVLPQPDPMQREGGQGLNILGVVSSEWGAVPTADGKMVWAEFDRPND